MGHGSMSFSLIPPEINSALMFSGAGSGPLLEASAAWDRLAGSIWRATATRYQTAGHQPGHRLVAGPSSAQMAAATAPYIAWLQGTAATAAQTGAQAQVAAAAYQSAYASMVPLPEILANRALLAELVANNFLGQNTGAIATTEANYLDMWIQDALVMDTYQVSSQAATALPAQVAAPQVASGAQAGQPSAAAATPRPTRRHGDRWAALDLAHLFGDATADAADGTFGCRGVDDLARVGGYFGSRQSHGRAASGAGHLLHGHAGQHARTYVHELGRLLGQQCSRLLVGQQHRHPDGERRQVHRRQNGHRGERCGRPTGGRGGRAISASHGLSPAPGRTVRAQRLARAASPARDGPRGPGRCPPPVSRRRPCTPACPAARSPKD